MAGLWTRLRAAIGGCKDLQPGHRMKKFAKIDVGISVWQKSKVIAHKPSRCSTQVSVGTWLNNVICSLKCLIRWWQQQGLSSFLSRRSNSNPNCCQWHIKEQHLSYALCTKIAWTKVWTIGFGTYRTAPGAMLCSEPLMNIWTMLSALAACIELLHEGCWAH